MAMAAMTREQFDAWIERVRPEAIPYVATILKNRGSTLPKLRRPPDRHHDRLLDFGEEEGIFNGVVLTLLGDQGEDDQGEPLPLKEPPPYTTFPGALDDFAHFKAWLFNWLKNAARNEDRRERRRGALEVSAERDRAKTRKGVREKRSDRALDADSLLEQKLIQRAKADTTQEYRQIEDDNTRRLVLDATPEEDEQTARLDDALVDEGPRPFDGMDADQVWALLTDFTLDIDGVAAATGQPGRPPKWDEGDVRAMFFEWHHLRHALRCAYGKDLSRKPDETASAHTRRVTDLLLELDREWVHPAGGFSPFALSVPTRGLDYRPEPGYTFLFRIVDSVYPALTAPAAMQIAHRTEGREGALALALVAYYHNLRLTQVKALLEKGRQATPGAARKRARASSKTAPARGTAP